MYKPLRLWLRGSTFLLRCSDQSTALQAFACSPLGRSDRPSFARATSAPTLRPPALWAFVLRFPASARPPLPAFDLRRVGCGAINRPSASAFGWVALVGFASLRSLGGVLSPLRSDHVVKENCKRLCLSQFFFQQKHH